MGKDSRKISFDVINGYKNTILIIIFLFFFLKIVTASPHQDLPISNAYNAKHIQGFIEYLISKDEYYRAYLELKRLDSYYPGYMSTESYCATELYLLFKGRRYSEILSKKADSMESNLKAINIVFKTDTLFEKNDYLKANALLASTACNDINKDIHLYLYKRTLLSCILLDRIDEAKGIIANNNNIEIDFKNQFTDIIGYSKDYSESYKKPYIGLMSGIVPGMGYIYSGDTATGIIAFILISLLSSATYYSFRTDEKPVGIFIGVAAGFFYGGSILGGYLSTKRYNDSKMNSFRDALSQKMNLMEDRQEIFTGYGIPGGGE